MGISIHAPREWHGKLGYLLCKSIAKKPHSKKAKCNVAEPNEWLFGDGIDDNIDNASGETAKIMPHQDRIRRSGHGNVEHTSSDTLAKNSENTVKKQREIYS